MKEALEWDQVRPMSMPTFLDRFTLHDALFKGVRIDGDGRVTVEIGFDLVLNPSIPTGFDTLVFRFDRPYLVRWVQGSWHDSTLSGAESVPLDSVERADLLQQPNFDLRAYQGPRDDILHPANDDTVTRTRVDFLNWATLEILHGGAVRFLVVDPEFGTIDVSTIESAAT